MRMVSQLQTLKGKKEQNSFLPECFLQCNVNSLIHDLRKKE